MATTHVVTEYNDDDNVAYVCIITFVRTYTYIYIYMCVCVIRDVLVCQHVSCHIFVNASVFNKSVCLVVRAVLVEGVPQSKAPVRCPG